MKKLMTIMLALAMTAGASAQQKSENSDAPCRYGCAHRLSSPYALSLSVILLNNHNPKTSGSPKTCRTTNMAEMQNKPIDKYKNIIYILSKDIYQQRGRNNRNMSHA